MKNKKIFFFVTEDWYFCSHRLPLAIAAKEMGMDVRILTRVAQKKNILKFHGLNFIHIEIDRSSVNPFTEIKKIWDIYNIFRRERPDLIHLVALKPVLLGGLAARLAGIDNIVAAVTGMGFLFTGKRGVGILKKAVLALISSVAQNGKIIVQNNDDLKLLCSTGFNPERIALIKGAGVDTEYFKPVPEPKGIPVVMLASRLLWEKGVGEFVEAARLVKNHGIDCSFVLVGEPDLANPGAVPDSKLKAWLTEGIITWWGKQQDMPAILSKATIVCLPSYREGLPKVLLEAMACGRPCITTDTPGCRDAVRHGENGLLVPARDPHALAAAIKQLLNDPGQRQQMGRHGRKMTETEFSQDRVVQQTMRIYMDMLDNAAETGGRVA